MKFPHLHEYLDSIEDTGHALHTVEQLDPEYFVDAMKAVQDRMSALESIMRRFQCSRCGQPVIFAIEDRLCPGGTFTGSCANGPDGAYWEEIVSDDPDWGIPDNELRIFVGLNHK